MENFNLEKWQKGGNVCLRNGKQVKDLTYLSDAYVYVLVGVVDQKICVWDLEGKMEARRREYDEGFDLVLMEKDKWINVENVDGIVLFAHYEVFENYEMAVAKGKTYKDYCGTYKLVKQ